MTKAGESFGVRLRSLRLERGLTQASLAAPKYSAAYVSTIEAGRRNPSNAATLHFAHKLGVDPDELRSGVPSRAPIELQLRLQEAYSLLFSGHYSTAAAAFRSVERDAADLKLVRVEAGALEGQAIIAEREGEPSQALLLFEQALARLESEPLPLRAEAVAGVARCHQMLGNTRLALHLLESLLLQLEKQDLIDPTAAMRLYSSMIWPLSELGLHDQAAQAAREALRLETRVEDPSKVASMHLNVARQLLQQGRSSDALDSLRRAEDLFRSLNWKMEVARAYSNQAIVLAQQGDFDAARQANRKARELVAESPNRLTRARSLNEAGRIERLAGDPDAAVAALQEAFGLLQQVDVGELALTNRELGLCHLALGRHDEAEEHLRSAVALYTRAENKLELAATYRLLGDLLKERGKADGALEAYRKGLVSLESSTAA